MKVRMVHAAGPPGKAAMLGALAITAVVVLAGCGPLGAAGGGGQPGQGSGGMMGGNGGMMGGNGGMMGGMMDNANATQTSPQALRQRVQALAPAIRADATTNQIRYTARQVTVVMAGAPEGAPDMSWQVDGRTQPTVVIPAGSRVTIIFANGDADYYHGWELTTVDPPYSEMPMMSVPVAAPGAFAMPVAPAQGDRWSGATLAFGAPAPGTYYYLCPVMGHAQQGMWGKLIVQ